MRIAQRELDALGVASDTGSSPRTTRRERRGRVVVDAAAAAAQQNASSTSTPANATASPDQPTTKSHLGKRELESLGDSEEPGAGDRTERRLRRQRRVAELAAQGLARHRAELEAAVQAQEAIQAAKTTTEVTEEVTLTCAACGGEYPAQDSVRFGTCQEASGHCRECLQKWLSIQIGDAVRVRDIRCPCGLPGCEGYATDATVREHATVQHFEMFDTLQTRELLEQMPGYRTCPSAECRSGQILDDADGNIFKCGACGHRHWTDCDVPFHDGESCEIFTSRKQVENMSKAEQEAACEAEINRVAATCPRHNCGARIRKNGGCDHMTCRLCKTEFCLLCSAPYGAAHGIRKVGNTAHKPHCKYHA